MLFPPDHTTWYLEVITPDLVHASGLKKIFHQGQTPFQHAQVLETGSYGRMLVLDGKTQSSEADEWVYHEGLVQPVMVAHPNPRTVFIAGGGEGATAREVLRHRTVTKCVMVDLDKEVVDLCKQYLPNHHAGAFDDPRLTLLHDDALKYLEDTDEHFDVIIIDIPDPLEGGPAWLLYTVDFYKLVQRRLNPGGLTVLQSGPCGPVNYTDVFTAIHKTVATAFHHVHPYRVYMPAFVSTWGFQAAGMADSPDLGKISAEEIDRRIAERLASPLRYYDGIAHHGLLGLPKYVRDGMKAETRVITRDNPIFFV
ncbi:MAG: polyamine aminopropyltransferase [SAR202 cluster bacterium]|nr:polyamine aminopropyltransferase [SAR202 cluster bacterium]